MRPRSAPDLLAALYQRTEANLAAARALAQLDDTALRRKPRPGAWNALECLAHLNHYGDYYLPEIRRAITAAPPGPAPATFTSSWLGNKFAAGLKPGPKTRKIKTFKNANPVNFTSDVDRGAITEFIRQQEETLELLDRARTVDLTRTKTGTSLSRFIRLRLGDTLRVFIYHNWRHVEQGLRAAGVS